MKQYPALNRWHASKRRSPEHPSDCGCRVCWERKASRAARRQVHVINDRGLTLFNRLWDDGSDVLQFESGFGHVTRHDVTTNGWSLAAGWADECSICRRTHGTEIVHACE